MLNISALAKVDASEHGDATSRRQLCGDISRHSGSGTGKDIGGRRDVGRGELAGVSEGEGGEGGRCGRGRDRLRPDEEGVTEVEDLVADVQIGDAVGECFDLHVALARMSATRETCRGGRELVAVRGRLGSGTVVSCGQAVEFSVEWIGQTLDDLPSHVSYSLAAAVKPTVRPPRSPPHPAPLVEILQSKSLGSLINSFLVQLTTKICPHPHPTPRRPAVLTSKKLYVQHSILPANPFPTNLSHFSQGAPPC